MFSSVVFDHIIKHFIEFACNINLARDIWAKRNNKRRLTLSIRLPIHRSFRVCGIFRFRILKTDLFIFFLFCFFRALKHKRHKSSISVHENV